SPSPHGDGLPGAGGDPAFVQAVHRVRVLEHGQSDVPYPDPAGCKALLRALMRVTVHGEVRPGRVDRLPQQVAAEERIDLRRLPRQGVLSGGVMRQADDDVGVQVRQRLVQPRGEVPGVPDERLHLRLAEVAGALALEPAAEPLAARDAEPGPPGRPGPPPRPAPPRPSRAWSGRRRPGTRPPGPPARSGAPGTSRPPPARRAGHPPQPPGS